MTKVPMVLVSLLWLVGCPGPPPELPTMCRHACGEWKAFSTYCGNQGQWVAPDEYGCRAVAFMEETVEECKARMLEDECSNEECYWSYYLANSGHGEAWCPRDNGLCFDLAGEECQWVWNTMVRDMRCSPVNWTIGEPCVR